MTNKEFEDLYNELLLNRKKNEEKKEEKEDFAFFEEEFDPVGGNGCGGVVEIK